MRPSPLVPLPQTGEGSGSQGGSPSKGGGFVPSRISGINPLLQRISWINPLLQGLEEEALPLHFGEGKGKEHTRRVERFYRRLRRRRRGRNSVPQTAAPMSMAMLPGSGTARMLKVQEPEKIPVEPGGSKSCPKTGKFRK